MRGNVYGPFLLPEILGYDSNEYHLSLRQPIRLLHQYNFRQKFGKSHPAGMGKSYLAKPRVLPLPGSIAPDSVLCLRII